MTLETAQPNNLALATAERAVSVLQERIKVGGTYWIPALYYERNKLVEASWKDYYVEPLSENSKERAVDVFYRETVKSITASVDEEGKPIILVELGGLEEVDFAIRRRGGIGFGLTHGLFMSEVGPYQFGTLTFCPTVQLPPDLQGFEIAPETVRVGRQILRLIPQDVKIEYYIQ